MPINVVRNDFPRIGSQLQAKAKKAEERAAQRIADRDNRTAPVGETGDLSRGTRAVGNVVVNTVPYGRFVNRGTRFMAAQPFFDEALEAERTQFEAELLEALR
jgi:HK97 gp10 family phage protein